MSVCVEAIIRAAVSLRDACCILCKQCDMLSQQLGLQHLDRILMHSSKATL